MNHKNVSSQQDFAFSFFVQHKEALKQQPPYYSPLAPFPRVLKGLVLLLFFAISSTFVHAQISFCPSNNNMAPPFTTANAMDPTYGATLEVPGSLITVVSIDPNPSFCLDNDPSDGKSTESGCGTILFTNLPYEDSCRANIFFKTLEGCTGEGAAFENICMWREDSDNPGQWEKYGSGANGIWITIPAGQSEFSVTLCGPNPNSIIRVAEVDWLLGDTDVGADTAICSSDVPVTVDLTLHAPPPTFNPDPGRWEQIGIGPIADPENVQINGALGDQFSFIYSYEEVFFSNCIVKDTIVYTITDDCPTGPQVNISGTSSTWTGESIDNVMYTATNSTEQTTGSPDYLLTLDDGANENIQAERMADPIPKIGITTVDILLTRAHILQNPQLSNPYQLLAADVNASGNITTTDYLQIQAMILQNISAFQPGNRLWAFMSSDYNFSDPLNPWTYDPLRYYTPLTAPDKIDQDFLGIKLGDVNGSWTAANGNRTGAIPYPIFAIEDLSVAPASVIRVPILASSFDKLSGYQCTIEWDPAILRFEQVESVSLAGKFGSQDSYRGYLNALWYEENAQAISLDPEEVLFELEFTVIGENGTASHLSIGSASIPAEAYTDQFDILEPASVSALINVGQTTSIDQPFMGYEAGPGLPNPFSDNIRIPFSIPNSETLEVHIYNLVGQRVWNYSNRYEGGTHEISWDRKDNSGEKLSEGIYIMRINLGDYETNLRLLVQN